MLNVKNYTHPKMEILILLLVSIVGILNIIYFSINKQNNLHKVAFVMIISFGLICCLIMPICDVSDGSEHFARSEITSRGILDPQFNGVGFEVSDSVVNFFDKEHGKTIFDTPHDTDKINSSLSNFSSAFQQNPFYGYIPQAMGIALAKLLDLNVIWMLWLGRIFNLITYALLISYSVKKSPIFKIPIIAMACVPLAIFQASSISIDSMIGGLGILAFSYFFYMYKSEDNSLGKKEIVTFGVISLLLGLCKLPFLAVSFLILFVPKSKFKDNNYWIQIILMMIIISIIGLIWAKYSEPNLMHSWRKDYSIRNNVNSKMQMQYLLDNPEQLFVSITNTIPNSFSQLFNGDFIFRFQNQVIGSYVPSEFLATIIPFYIGAIWLFYPNDVKINRRSRIGSLIISIIIYVAICFIILLTWMPVGNIYISGVNTRYFLPLFALMPFIFNLNYTTDKNEEIDYYIIVFCIMFMASLIIGIVANFY